jgi:hypothetical protein
VRVPLAKQTNSLEHGEVECETQTDGVGRWKLSDGNVGSGLVGLKRLVGRVFPLVTNGELSQVSVVVSHPVELVNQSKSRSFDSHLVVEHLGLARGGRRDKVLLEHLKNVLADLGKLGLNPFAVVSDHGDLRVVALALLLLLDGGDNAPRSSSGTNDVLVRNREQVSLLNGEFLVGRSDRLHVLDHFCCIRSVIHKNAM